MSAVGFRLPSARDAGPERAEPQEGAESAVSSCGFAWGLYWIVFAAVQFILHFVAKARSGLEINSILICKFRLVHRFFVALIYLSASNALFLFYVLVDAQAREADSCGPTPSSRVVWKVWAVC